MKQWKPGSTHGCFCNVVTRDIIHLLPPPSSITTVCKFSGTAVHAPLPSNSSLSRLSPDFATSYTPINPRAGLYPRPVHPLPVCPPPTPPHTQALALPHLPMHNIVSVCPYFCPPSVRPSWYECLFCLFVSVIH